MLAQTIKRATACSRSLRTLPTASVRFSSSSSSDAPEEAAQSAASKEYLNEVGMGGAGAVQDAQGAGKAATDKVSAKTAGVSAGEASESASAAKSYIDSLPRVPNTANIDKNDLYIDMLFGGYRPLLQPIRENHTRRSVPRASRRTFPPARVTDGNLKGGNAGSAGNATTGGSSPSAYSPFTNVQESNRMAMTPGMGLGGILDDEDALPLPPNGQLRPMPRGVRHSRRADNSSILQDLEKYKRAKAARKVANYNPWFSKERKFTPVFTVFTNSALNTEQHDLELFNLPLRIVENLRPFQVMNQPGQELFRDDMIYTRRLEVEERREQRKRERKQKYKRDLKAAKQGLKRLQIEDAREFFDFE